MANGVDRKAGGHAVGCQEDGVTVEKLFGHSWFHNVAGDGIESDAGVRLARYTLGDFDLERTRHPQNASQ